MEKSVNTTINTFSPTNNNSESLKEQIKQFDKKYKQLLILDPTCEKYQELYTQCENILSNLNGAK